jgi:hypothetical protein
MREDDEQGRPRVYWVAHGTSLLRCAGEQIRPIVDEIGQNLSLNFEAARQALQHVRRRGVTQYRDLTLLPAPEAGEFDVPMGDAEADTEPAPPLEPAAPPEQQPPPVHEVVVPDDDDLELESPEPDDEQSPTAGPSFANRRAQLDRSETSLFRPPPPASAQQRSAYDRIEAAPLRQRDHPYEQALTIEELIVEDGALPSF